MIFIPDMKFHNILQSERLLGRSSSLSESGREHSFQTEEILEDIERTHTISQGTVETRLETIPIIRLPHNKDHFPPIPTLHFLCLVVSEIDIRMNCRVIFLEILLSANHDC